MGRISLYMVHYFSYHHGAWNGKNFSIYGILFFIPPWSMEREEFLYIWYTIFHTTMEHVMGRISLYMVHYFSYHHGACNGKNFSIYGILLSTHIHTLTHTYTHGKRENARRERGLSH